MKRRTKFSLPEDRSAGALGARTIFLLGLVLLLLCPAGCGLTEKERYALEGYKQNSKSYYNSGKYPETIDQCKKGLRVDDDDYSLNLTLAWALLLSGTKQSLFDAYAQFKRTDVPHWFGYDLWALVGLGDEKDFRVSLGLGQTCYKIATLYGQRIAHFNRLIEADPESKALYVDEMAECQKEMEAYTEEARVHLERTLAQERQKENIDAILTMGQVHAYSGDFDGAVEYMRRGLDLLEQSMNFEVKRLENNDTLTADGKQFFERQLRRNKKREKELRGILASVYNRLGDHELALEQYNILEERDLFDEIQHYNRGMALQALERYEEAIEEYKRYLNRSSVAGRNFDEDEHFHLAFERIEACRTALATLGGTANGTPRPREEDE